MSILSNLFKFVEPAASTVLTEFAKNVAMDVIRNKSNKEDEIYDPGKALAKEAISTVVGAVANSLSETSKQRPSNTYPVKPSSPYDEAKKEKYKYNF